MNEELFKLPSDEGHELAIWKISQPEIPTKHHIYMTHGTFSDKRICRGIASYLAKKGYTSWIMEWRGHGASTIPKEKYNFETIAKKDVPIAFEYLFNELNIKELSCVLHSGGGAIMAMFLTHNQQYISKIKSMTMFGSQTTGAGNSMSNKIKLFVGKYVTALLGHSYASMFGRPHDETYFMMKLWYDWNLSRRFLGENNFDYDEHLPKITTPIFSIHGKKDTFIATKSGSEEFLHAFQNPKNKFLSCGKNNGYSEDYDHGRVMLSRNAEKEVWPQVLEWIVEHHC